MGEPVNTIRAGISRSGNLLIITPWPAPISTSATSKASSTCSASNAPKCDRKGRYHVHKLIEKYGRMGNVMKWREMLNADCPKRDTRLHDRCDLICPMICRRSCDGLRAANVCNIPLTDPLQSDIMRCAPGP
jgi:hypothetical protein